MPCIMHEHGVETTEITMAIGQAARAWGRQLIAMWPGEHRFALDGVPQLLDDSLRVAVAADSSILASNW